MGQLKSLLNLKGFQDDNPRLTTIVRFLNVIL